MEIYALRITEMEETKFHDLLKFVEVDKQAKINRFRRFEDAQRALFAELLIRQIICVNLKMENSSIEFGKNEYGKPFLIGSEEFHFNLSHSQDWVVCAVDKIPVGIDVEIIKQINLDIAQRFFSGMEYEGLMLEEESKRVSRFFEIWTLKESYIKAWGKGLSAPLDSFAIIINKPEISIHTKNEYNNCFFKQYNIDPDYKMAVCSGKKEFPARVIMRSVEDVYLYFMKH